MNCQPYTRICMSEPCASKTILQCDIKNMPAVSRMQVSNDKKGKPHENASNYAS